MIDNNLNTEMNNNTYSELLEYNLISKGGFKGAMLSSSISGILTAPFLYFLPSNMLVPCLTIVMAGAFFPGFWYGADRASRSFNRVVSENTDEMSVSRHIQPQTLEA